ncbi:membrane-bound glycerophospholipid O-acyltransferase 2-like [Glandiceps talaboti]
MAPGLQYVVSTVCRLTGVAETEVRFLVFQVICLVLAILYRHLLHPSKVTPTTRHIVATALGLYIGVYNYSWSVCHLLLQSTVAYIIMKVIDPKRSMPQVVFLFAMGYLCVVQLRKALANDLTSADYSTSMMIITQRITDLAYSIHDGSRDESKLNPKQKELAVRRFPTVLEYYSYIFHFQALLVGPFCFYKHYMEYVDGKNLLTTTSEDKYGKPVVAYKEPSAMAAVLGKVVCSVGMMGIVLVAGRKFPIFGNASDEVVNSSFLYRAMYLVLSVKVCEMRYVLAWLLVDAICNASGLGFNGYDSNGKPKWDLVTNVHYLSYLVRRNIRPYFLQSSQMKTAYDLMTWFVTSFSTPYFTVSFPLYTYQRIITFYSGFYFGGHILTILLILVLPSIKPVKKSELNSNDITYESGCGRNGHKTQDGMHTAKKEL